MIAPPRSRWRSAVPDPIPAPQPFAPTDWGSAYQAIALQHVRKINVHDFTHYLEHPAVSAITRSKVWLASGS